MPTDPVLRNREERLLALKTMIGKLAHDLNNSMVPVVGYTSLIQELVGEDSPAHEFISLLEKSANNTVRFLDTLLLAARPQRKTRLETCNFRQLIEQEVQLWQGALPDSARLVMHMELQPCTLTLDVAQWERVLEELLKNAWDACKGPGMVHISLSESTPSKSELAKLGVEEFPVTTLLVRDNGTGMEPEALEHALDPFYTTKPKPAPGLGLTVVHGIVRHHGGQILLERGEHGTVIRILIPKKPPI